jgi:hypothetical protein
MPFDFCVLLFLRASSSDKLLQDDSHITLTQKSAQVRLTQCTGPAPHRHKLHHPPTRQDQSKKLAYLISLTYNIIIKIWPTSQPAAHLSVN